ncbi:MAG: hypothetical protein M1825_003285 [Sarcosagium campestre]|nr:MAG: hypothetical protein M1825_003285 [Sarcosagium campestre]
MTTPSIDSARPNAIEAVKASVPPKAEPYTFLTILESHLSIEVLPTLLEILQDRDLTSSIGWDLVHLLLPLLPHSQSCLDVVARFGNPREVVLKVAESLRKIDFASEDDHRSADEETNVKSTPQLSEDPSKSDDEIVLSPSALQFKSLVSMLPILHQRIKTTYPSRFLASTLKAVVPTFTEASQSLPNIQTEVIANEIIRFIKVISGKKRPHLPPRRSTRETVTTLESAPDPEAHSDLPSQEEFSLQDRLLQSFCTHLLEDYVLSLSSFDDVIGLAWSARIYEKLYPEKTVPHRKPVGELFLENSSLQERDSTIGRIVAVALDLNLSSDDLLHTLLEPAAPFEDSGDNDLPSSPSEIPLSLPGSLFLLTSRVASSLLFSPNAAQLSLSIFPDYATIMQRFVGAEEIGGMSGIGSEAEPLIDAALALGLWCMHRDAWGDLKGTSDDRFNEFLQRTSLLSANSPSPRLRYYAHLICSSVLQSTDDVNLRLGFIRDTLEHCPFENLKASAVGWLKDEILKSRQLSVASSSHQPTLVNAEAIDRIYPFLFPDVTTALSSAPNPDSWATFKSNFSFYVAGLNFYYFLLTSSTLPPSFDVTTLHSKYDITKIYLDPLRKASASFVSDLQGGTLAELEGEDQAQAGIFDLRLLENALDQVAGSVPS